MTERLQAKLPTEKRDQVTTVALVALHSFITLVIISYFQMIYTEVKRTNKTFGNRLCNFLAVHKKIKYDLMTTRW